jgi:hypothetical protein
MCLVLDLQRRHPIPLLGETVTRPDRERLRPLLMALFLVLSNLDSDLDVCYGDIWFRKKQS